MPILSNHKKRILRTTVLSLLLGLLVPIANSPVVSADPLITKTVYVKDRNGAPLAGATVVFGYGSLNVFEAATEPATTNSDGRVDFTFPSDYLTTYKLGMWVEPPAGDTQNAIAQARSINIKTYNGSTPGVYLDPTTSGRIDIQLKPSTIVLNPTFMSGESLPIPVFINAPIRLDGGAAAGQVKVSTFVVLRAGAFGINVDSSITQSELDALSGINSTFALSVFDPNQANILFRSTNYRITLGSPATLTQYDDSTNPPTLVSPQPTPVAGVYSTNNQGSNIFLSVKDPRNSQPLANGDNGYVAFFAQNSAGERGNWAGDSQINDEGKISKYLSDGTYLAVVNGPSSIPAGQVPTFGTSTYTVTVSGTTISIINGILGGGGATVTKDSNNFFQTSYTLANIVGQVLSAPNTPIVFQSNNDNQLCTHLQLMDSAGEFQDLWDTESCSQNPSYGLIITSAGTYRVQIRPYGFSGYTNTTTQNIVVTGTAGNLTLASAGSESGSKLTKNITLNIANIVGQVFSAPNTPLVFGNNNDKQLCTHLQVMDNSGNFQDLWDTQVCDGQNSSYGVTVTTAGTYRVEIRPSGFSGYTTTTTQNIVVTGTAGNLTLASAGSDSGSILTKNIILNVANLHLKVINPNDSNNPLDRGWVNINTWDGDRETGYFDSNVESRFGSVVDAKLVDGTYLLTVNSNISGLAQQKYTIVVASGNITMYLGSGTSGTPVSADSSQVFTVRPSAANVTGIFQVNGAVAPNTPSSNIQICDQYLVNGNWQWDSCTNSSNTTGVFTFSVTKNGTHRISFQPNGLPSIATTYSPQFVVAGNGTSITFNGTTAGSHNLGTIQAAQPTLSVKVIAGGVEQKNAGVEIRLNNQFVEWANTGSAGTVGIKLDKAGTYQFIVHPATSGAYSTKTYTVVATGNAGSLVITIAGVTPTGSTYVLPLAASSISGTVVLPDGVTLVKYTQVVATDASGQDLWQNSANVDQTGSWSMTLPAGVYSVRAMSPNGLTQYSDSKSMGDITVNSAGQATLSGEITAGDNTAARIILKLQLPYWSGTVKTPTVGSVAGVPEADAQVCLFAPMQGRCTNTDAQGRWSMSKPKGFSDFDATYSLQVRPNNSSNFAATTFSGKAAINGAGFLTAGASSIALVLSQPNFVLTVTAPDGTSTSDLWVNVSPLNGGQMLSNGGTDSTGKVSLSIPQANFSTGLRINVDVQNNSAIAAKYGQTTKDFSAADLTAGLANGIYSVSLALVEPNIRGQLTYVGGAEAGNTNADLFSVANQNWVTSGYVGQTGSFTLNAPKTGSAVSYTLTVRPPYNSAIPAAAHSYRVNVKADGTIDSITDPNNSDAALTASSSGIYTFSLVSPSVTGVVVSRDNKNIPNSWVSPNLPGQEGSNTDSNGKFALALPDGTWPLQANIPWGDSTYAPSALCTVTVLNGATTAVTGGCSFNDSTKVISIPLQDPNLTVTLKDASGAAIQNGYVSVDVGNWHSGSQTDSSGISRIFVDWNAIKTSNAIQTGPVGMHVGLHPGWGTSSSITLDCDSQNQSRNAACPDVQAINGEFATTAWTVTLPAPNTRLSVVEDMAATTGQQNAWATLFTYAPAANGNDGYINGYVGGSNSDSTGVAVFNVLNPTDTSIRYAVQVNPAWNDTTHAQQTLTNNGAGYTYAEINNQKFALGSPNLTLTSLDKTGNSVNRGGWVCAEYFNTTLGYSRQWISCVGLNQLGTTKMLLPDTVSSNADKKYVRITFNSGDSSYGATTSCTVTVSNGVVAGSDLATSCTVTGSTISQRLSSGNVQGFVKRADASAVVGAIIKATIHGTTGDVKEASAIMTSTGTDGSFGLQLDSSKLWDIKIIPVHVSDSPDLAARTVQDATTLAETGTGMQPPAVGNAALIFTNITLALKP